MPSIVTRWVDGTGTVQSSTGAELKELPSDAGLIWVDITAPTDAVLDDLRAKHGFHALAVEDVLHPQARPKLDAYPDGLFLVWLSPRELKGDGVIVDELDAFIGKDLLVTIHDAASEAIDAVALNLDRSMRRGADWLLHAIIDRLVDATLPLVDDLGDRLESIEDAMLADNPRQSELRSLHEVRRRLVKLHRIAAPERDILRSFARESEVIGEDAYRYFQDVGDHVARVLDAIETYQDVAASVMDVYLSAQNNRMNEIMKQLTVVATIFMPLTLLSGIYGMNVVAGMWPPPLARWSFVFIVGAMALIAVVMAAFFRKKNWW